MRATNMKKAISKTRLLLSSVAGGNACWRRRPSPRLLASPAQPSTCCAAQAYISQPDGQMVYSWGYGCNGARTAFAPAYHSPAIARGCRFPARP